MIANFIPGVLDALIKSVIGEEFWPVAVTLPFSEDTVVWEPLNICL